MMWPEHLEMAVMRQQLVAPGFRTLPIGIPKLIVSTVASGQVGGYVGASDITMMYSVTDLAGLNRITRVILSNAAGAIIGMVQARERQAEQSGPTDDRPAIGLTMFGVTTPCVRMLEAALTNEFDCLVFHATGTGGQSMEKLARFRLAFSCAGHHHDRGLRLLIGQSPCTDDRFGAIARSKLPYVGSCGALDMVNFGPPETVPDRYAGRLLYRHNPHVTLMRTSPDENAQIGAWIGERLNRCEGPVELLLPEGGVSLLGTRLANRSSTKRLMQRSSRPWSEPCDRPACEGWNACRTQSTIPHLQPSCCIISTPRSRRPDACISTGKLCWGGSMT